MSTELKDISNSIGDLSEQFSTSKNYYPGQFISYQDKIYKFIQIHPAGEWNPNDVEETSIFGEFQGLDEKVTITISGLSDLEGKAIVVNVEGEPNPRNLTTNSLGQAETSIRKGLTYDIYPQPYGSYIVQDYLNVKAALNQRYINIPYLLGGQPETCTVEVNINTSGSINDFTGLELTIFNQSNQQALVAIIDSNGKATFNNVTKYTTYIINSTGIIPKANTYRKPSNSTILTNFDTNSVNLEYIKIYQVGIFLVNGNDWSETEITQEFIDTLDNTMKSTYPYIHVCTEDLANAGCDYYIRCRDLTSERIATESANKQWSTASLAFPHVSYSTTDYNGRKQTYYMLSDPFTLNLGCYSPAAVFACGQSIEINGDTLSGFIGTQAQAAVGLTNTNKSMIFSTINKIGYNATNTDFRIWTSTYGGTPFYRSVVLYMGGSGSFAGQNNTNSVLVVPFFSK